MGEAGKCRFVWILTSNYVDSHRYSSVSSDVSLLCVALTNTWGAELKKRRKCFDSPFPCTADDPTHCFGALRQSRAHIVAGSTCRAKLLIPVARKVVSQGGRGLGLGVGVGAGVWGEGVCELGKKERKILSVVTSRIRLQWHCFLLPQRFHELGTELLTQEF